MGGCFVYKLKGNFSLQRQLHEPIKITNLIVGTPAVSKKLGPTLSRSDPQDLGHTGQ